LSAPPAKPHTLTLAAKHNGKSFTVLKGMAVVVKLSASAGTAYTWQATKVPSFLAEDKGAEAGPQSPGLPGGKVYRVFRYTTTGKGSGALSFALTSGMPSHPPAKTFSVTLHAKG